MFCHGGFSNNRSKLIRENNEYNNACRIRAGVFTGISFAARNCPWWRPFGISLIFHTRHWHLGSHSIHYSAEPYDGMCCLGSTKFMKPFISQQCASPSFRWEASRWRDGGRARYDPHCRCKMAMNKLCSRKRICLLVDFVSLM